MHKIHRALGHFGNADGAVHGLCLQDGWPRYRMVLGCYLAGGDGLPHQHVDDIAVFRVQRYQATVLLESQHGAKQSTIVNHHAAAIGHVHLDAGDPRSNEVWHLSEARLVCLDDDDVKAVVNTGTIACFPLPCIVGIVQRLALVLLGKINNRRRPTHCGSAASGEKIVTGGRRP